MDMLEAMEQGITRCMRQKVCSGSKAGLRSAALQIKDMKYLWLKSAPADSTGRLDRSTTNIELQ